MTVESKSQGPFETASAGIEPIPWYNLALPFSERRVLLVFGDLVLLILAGLLSLAVQAFLQDGVVTELALHQSTWLLLLSVVWLLLVTVNDCYDLKVAHHQGQIVQAIAISTVEAGVFYLVLFFIFGRPVDPASVVPVTHEPLISLPRISSLIFLVLVPAFTLTWRMIYLRLFKNLDVLRPRAIIVGAGESARVTARMMQQAYHDYEIAGFVADDDHDEPDRIDGLPVLGSYGTLLQQLRATKSNEVIIAINELPEDLFVALMECYERGIAVKPMSLVYEQALGRIPVEHLRERWFPVPPWLNTGTLSFYSAFKRLTDVTCALIGLVCLAALFPLIAAAIYLDSPGPIFYTQERVGKGNSRFNVIKFRSMVPNAEKDGEARWATRDDSRITRVGRVLRQTRLDEVPQLINVLKGDMSIVGPRPERPEFVAELQEQIPFYRTRLRVKPGLTGLAQVRYHYGNTVEDALYKLQYDLYYIKHQSLLLDLLIILRTIKVIFTFKGT